MSGEDRRKRLFEKLQDSSKAITGSDLAQYFEVSRQVIVQDIALLRAQGEEILATSQGYILPIENNGMVEKKIACQHNSDQVEDELATIIRYGGRVKDVIVEHSIYGELKGMLMIQSSLDLDAFMKKYLKEEVKPLSALTEGVHLHTVEALNYDVLSLIQSKLKEKGYLLEE